jgi:hypothetical protein
MGRRSLLAVVIPTACVAVLAVWVMGLRNVNGLPDVGDPFDVTEARRMIVVPASGSPPAHAGALAGGYLKELPVGIKRDELIPAGID